MIFPPRWCFNCLNLVTIFIFNLLLLRLFTFMIVAFALSLWNTIVTTLNCVQPKKVESLMLIVFDIDNLANLVILCVQIFLKKVHLLMMWNPTSLLRLIWLDLGLINKRLHFFVTLRTNHPVYASISISNMINQLLMRSFKLFGPCCTSTIY